MLAPPRLEVLVQPWSYPTALVASALARLTTAGMASRIRVEKGGDGNDDVDEHAEHAFEVVGLLVAEEGPDYEDGQNERDRVENLELHVHADVETPADNDDKRSVEQSGLNGGAEYMGKSHVHLSVVGFVNGEDVF
jgi:hypothetical protein